MGDVSRWEQFRMWLAGGLFWLAGRVHYSYDVWLDGCEPKVPDGAWPQDGQGQGSGDGEAVSSGGEQL